MILRICLRFTAIAMLLLLLEGIFAAMAASNTVPVSGIDDDTIAVTANRLKPAACAGLNLTSIVHASGVYTDTHGSSLILGSAGDDTLYGSSGDDCILGGGGDDTLLGGSGDDVCMGGPGSDTLDASCEGP
jgi:Ca2+-binding RTX toxin-like protein